MIDTKKLLYIFPDVAYIAEGLPSKKPYTFSIHSFTQVNGSFMTEDAFTAENIQKLFSKLESGENYHIILPDFLFTSTIVSIKEKSDTAIKEFLQSTTFPQMGITKDSHLIDSAVLNEIRGTSRVQLSAIEKELLAPLRVAAVDHAITISGVSPLSWAIKSLISLEPSISVLQMGTHLYACEHYIGIDQASYAPIDDVGSIAETIKTLKGSEPSIQTVYLLSNPLIEEKLKDALQKTLPIQQMATSADSEERMPASVKEVIEFSFKTLAIADYPVPVFPLSKPSAEEIAAFGAVATTQGSDPDEDTTEAVLPKPATPVLATATSSESSKAEVKAENGDDFEPADAAELEKEAEELAQKEASTDPEDAGESEEDVEEKPQTPAVLPPPVTPASAAAPLVTSAATATLATAVPAATTSPVPVLPPSSTPEKGALVPPTSGNPDSKPTETPADSLAIQATEAVKKGERVPTVIESPKQNQDIDLTQFVGAQSKQEQPTVPVVAPKVATPLPTIKNKSGVQNMLKMIFITLAVFCLTIAVGVGVGLAVLKYSGSESAEQTPVVQVETTPVPTATPQATATPEPTPAASESATKAPTNLKILVVNATTKAGYAGTFKTKIEQSKLGKVTAGNAKGKYDSGFVVYMKKKDTAAISTLEKATSLKTTFDESAKDEDPQGTYDLVLVLAE